MKLTLIALMALALTGCATAPAPATAQTQFVQACGAYGVAFAAALQLREAGQLSAAQIAYLSQNDVIITPICTGPMPTNAAAATTEIMTAVTTIAVITKGKK
ncbi:MAG: hypothetical protein ACYC4K_01325 [Thiobacillus sp.]